MYPRRGGRRVKRTFTSGAEKAAMKETREQALGLQEAVGGFSAILAS
jgi:hypothetical protein